MTTLQSGARKSIKVEGDGYVIRLQLSNMAEVILVTVHYWINTKDAIGAETPM